jgi:hypothetical protein
MKRIINGRRYNTETATQVAEYFTGDRGNFGFVDEALYRTPRGNWFLAGRGGATSKYAVSCIGGGSVGGEGIIPLTPDAARDWLETYGRTDVLEMHFGDNIEDA